MADEETETTASVYYHIGNGGVTFSVQRRPEGKYGNGPHLCVSGSSHGTQMLGVDIQTTPEGLRALGLELLAAANDEYPRPSGSALAPRDSLPSYYPWSWADRNPYSHWMEQQEERTVVHRMKDGEKVEKVEKERAEQEEAYWERAEALQKRVTVLRREVELAESTLAAHQRETPKMWKRKVEGEWVDLDPPDLARLWIARLGLQMRKAVSPGPRVGDLGNLFDVIECDEPWEISLSTWLGVTTPDVRELEKALRGDSDEVPESRGPWQKFVEEIEEASSERGWSVETGTHGDAGRQVVRVTKGVGAVVIRQRG